jgi:hypothetical protein
MKTTISIVLLTAALTVSAQQNLFEQGAPGSPVPEPRNATEPLTLLNRLVYSQAGASSSRDSVPPLILQFTGADPSAMSHMEEDLSVMTRLTEKSLERNLGENSPDYKMGIPMLVTASGRSVRAVYLDGFGAVFMIKVNFPVLAPPTTEEKKPERTVEDSEWERTRKEVLGIHEPGDGSTWVGAEVPYDAALVEALKKELLETLKNASNIRGLKSEEFICVTVFGGPNITFGKRTTGSIPGQSAVPAPAKPTARRDTKTPPGVPGSAAGYAVNYSGRAAGQGTVLTLRVKKSDVDAFATGKLDFKAFEKRATFNTYLGSGYDITSVNSWSRPNTSYGSSSSSLRRP